MGLLSTILTGGDDTDAFVLINTGSYDGGTVTDLDLAAGETASGDAVRFDPERIYFFGHSHGGLSGALAERIKQEFALKSVQLAGRPDLRRLRLYASTEAHSSIEKAAIEIEEGVKTFELAGKDGEGRRFEIDLRIFRC